MHGFQVYKMYLAMKLHFTQPKYDFFECNGQGRAKEKTYQERNDFWFFETMAKKLSDNEVQDFLLASFVQSDDPTKVWIGDIKRTGKDRWLAYQNKDRVCPTLLSKILVQWLNIWRPKGIPLTIYLRHWDRILPSSASTSREMFL